MLSLERKKEKKRDECLEGGFGINKKEIGLIFTEKKYYYGAVGLL